MILCFHNLGNRSFESGHVEETVGRAMEQKIAWLFCGKFVHVRM